VHGRKYVRGRFVVLVRAKGHTFVDSARRLAYVRAFGHKDLLPSTSTTCLRVAPPSLLVPRALRRTGGAAR